MIQDHHALGASVESDFLMSNSRKAPGSRCVKEISPTNSTMRVEPAMRCENRQGALPHPGSRVTIAMPGI